MSIGIRLSGMSSNDCESCNHYSEKNRLLNLIGNIMISLIKSTIELELEYEEIGGCDHSVGSCCCSLQSLIYENIYDIEKYFDKKWCDIKKNYL